MEGRLPPSQGEAESTGTFSRWAIQRITFAIPLRDFARMLERRFFPSVMPVHFWIHIEIFLDAIIY
jgi:hypothetical protein